MKRSSALNLNRYLSQKVGEPLKDFQSKPRTAIEKENDRLAKQLGTTAQDARDIQMGRAPSTLPNEVLNGTNGYVYLIRSSSHPKDTYKIGATNKTMQERLKGLNNTSVITPFRVVEAFWVETDPFKLEREIHAKLAGYRINKNREFFKCSKATILSVMKDVCGNKSTSRDQFKKARETSLARHKMEQTLINEWEEAKRSHDDAVRAFQRINNDQAAPSHDPLYSFKHSHPAYNYDREIEELRGLTKILQSKYIADCAEIRRQEKAIELKVNEKKKSKVQTIVVSTAAIVIFPLFSNINKESYIFTLLAILGIYLLYVKCKQQNPQEKRPLINLKSQRKPEAISVSRYEQFIPTWTKNGLSTVDIQKHLLKKGLTYTIEEIELISNKNSR
ncbi:GIY-YIG nuclease family protein [Vibrio gigantis]